MGQHRSTMAIRGLRLAAVLLVALTVSACGMVSGSWEWRSSSRVVGHVQLAHTGLPVLGEVEFAGPARRAASTNRAGRFALQLPSGTYQGTLRTLHNRYQMPVSVWDETTFTWTVKPPWFDVELFDELSGLRSLYVHGGRLEWMPGELVRWEQSEVRIYIATPTGYDWGATYWREVSRWEELLDYRIRFRRVSSPQQANILVELVPPGSMGNEVGMAIHLAYYDNGALQKVMIRIDSQYADYPGLWEHEFAHAMGLSHVADRSSVMHPRLEAGQRTTLSYMERQHARLIYDIPSGQRMTTRYAVSAQHADGEMDGAEPIAEPLRLSGYRGHVTTSDGQSVPLSDAEAEWWFAQPLK